MRCAERLEGVPVVDVVLLQIRCHERFCGGRIDLVHRETSTDRTDRVNTKEERAFPYRPGGMRLILADVKHLMTYSSEQEIRSCPITEIVTQEQRIAFRNGKCSGADSNTLHINGSVGTTLTAA